MFNCLRMAYYAVARGRQTGIFRSWSECENQTKGFSGAKFKKFGSQKEAEGFIGGPPPAKKSRYETNISFPKRIEIIQQTRATTSSSASTAADSNLTARQPAEDSDDELFEALQEYPDTMKNKFLQSLEQYPDDFGPSSNIQKKSRKTKVTEKATNGDPLAIKFEPPEPTTLKPYGKSSHKINFHEDAKGFVHVYTDGSCESNGKFLAAAGLGVYFGPNHPLNVAEPVTGRPTNNAGEIQAAIRAIKDAQANGVNRLNIFTDSQFLINSVCKWMSGWKKKNWKLASGRNVVNMKDFKELDDVIESGNMVVKWSYIPAHKGYDGNEEADKLAKIGASLFRKGQRKDNSDSDG